MEHEQTLSAGGVKIEEMSSELSCCHVSCTCSNDIMHMDRVMSGALL